MPVDRRALGDVEIDVSDSDIEAPSGFSQCLSELDLVEVTGIIVVDRRPQHLPQVADRSAAVRLATETLHLREHGWIWIGIESFLDHYAPRHVA